MWTLDTRWFDVAVVMSIFAIGSILFGHFEQHKPRGRRVAKVFVVVGVTLLVAETAGRAAAYGCSRFLPSPPHTSTSSGCRNTASTAGPASRATSTWPSSRRNRAASDQVASGFSHQNDAGVRRACGSTVDGRRSTVDGRSRGPTFSVDRRLSTVDRRRHVGGRGVSRRTMPPAATKTVSRPAAPRATKTRGYPSVISS